MKIFTISTFDVIDEQFDEIFQNLLFDIRMKFHFKQNSYQCINNFNRFIKTIDCFVDDFVDKLNFKTKMFKFDVRDL